MPLVPPHMQQTADTNARLLIMALQVMDAVKVPRKQNTAPVFQALFLLREASAQQAGALFMLQTPQRSAHLPSDAGKGPPTSKSPTPAYSKMKKNAR